MSRKPRPKTHDNTSVSSDGLRTAIRLQLIEGNPLDAEDIAMFEMFEREQWSHERRRAHILEQARKAAYRRTDAAE